MSEGAAIRVNQRSYRLPTRPTVVITIDGCEPEYLDQALARGVMPTLAAVLAGGGSYQRGLAHMPTLTNPNNMSIVTGAPPSVHGISGNHCLLDASSEPVQLVDPSYLRAPTIHAAVHEAGVPVLCVTAKDKLRCLLGAGGVPSVSAERAADLNLEVFGLTDLVNLVGRPVPSIYDWDLSAFALELGLAVHRHLAGGLRLLYVSLTDFVQHKEPPGGPLAEQFYRRFDELLAEYLASGLVVGITADHGMHAKQQADGSPRVIYLEEVLSAAGIVDARVVLPITDPYVRHHGALGSFAWIYFQHPDQVASAAEALARLDGIEEIYTRAEAELIYEHPADRIGDLSISANASTALGLSRDQHDLSLVATGLRSHGGRHEQIVPIIVSAPLTSAYAEWHRRGVRNSDLHDLLLNGLAD
jgi:phosphonoacetate hydrolase